MISMDGCLHLDIVLRRRAKLLVTLKIEDIAYFAERKNIEIVKILQKLT